MSLTPAVTELSGRFLDVPQFNGFTAVKKQTFLELFATNPNFTGCAKALGHDKTTVWYALERDPAFKQAFELVKDGLSDEMEGKVYEYGQRPQNFMDRIAWLRARRPEVWNPKPQDNQPSNVTVTVKLASEAQQYVDATVVPSEARTLTDGVDRAVKGTATDLKE